MDNATQRQRVLCFICQGILDGTYEGATWLLRGVPEQTWEVFKKAVDDRCLICSVIWHHNRERRHVWLQTPNYWEPMGYEAYKEPEWNKIVLQVLYKVGSQRDSDIVWFSLVPTDNEEVGFQLEFPDLEPTMTADAASATGLSWLNLCRSLHPDCTRSSFQAVSAADWHPTRLLDINTEDEAIWRLCSTSEDQIPPSAPYLTLSYRWSLNSSIRLLSSNVSDFRQGQPIAKLPQLFRNVIEVARKLSIRFIWIDALCIIQDLKDDWEKEVPTMQQVYTNSVLTLSASGTENPGDSLFHQRDFGFIMPGKVQCSFYSDKQSCYYIYDELYWFRQIFQGPLHNRGWVFQERFLSSRVLYFSRNQLLWECRGGHCCEVFPQGIPYHMTEKSTHALLYQTNDNSGTSDSTDEILAMWRDTVQQYSQCDLTRSSDKLPAIAGIAKLFQQATGDEYLAGLWKSRLLTMLCWRVDKPKPRRSLEYHAPSWSWASVESSVSLLPLDDSYMPVAELVKTATKTQTSDKMSTLISASIVLKARVIPAQFKSVHSSPPKADSMWIDTPISNHGIHFASDTVEADVALAMRNKQIVIVPLMVLGAGPSSAFSLVLEQLPNCQGRYRRLGGLPLYAAMMHKLTWACFEVDVTEIEIV